VIPVHAPDLGAAEAAALARCVEAGDASGQSPTVRAFEEAFAERAGAAHAVAVSSGTTALHLAFTALGLGPGDEVIVPAFTFAPCADMVALTGALPVYVDSDPATYNVTAEAVGAALTPATRAVLAVHLYGRPCDLTALAAVCLEAGVALVEDCAQGLGAVHAGRPVGSYGVLACYSFYANKVVTTGEGGMVTTSDDALAERLRWLRSHAQVADQDRAYLRTALGFNYRMPAFAAAVGLAQLGRLEEFLDRKAANAARYSAGLSGDVGLPAPVPDGDRHSHWAYAVTVAGGAAGLAAYLREHGVETRRAYHPLHLHPAGIGVARQPLPACEAFAPEGLVLPSGNALTPADVDAVIAAVRAWARVAPGQRAPTTR
jgi:perosamine synthetase